MALCDIRSRLVFILLKLKYNKKKQENIDNFFRDCSVASISTAAQNSKKIFL